MRLFQNCGVYPTYLKYFSDRHKEIGSFIGRRDAYLFDRYGALHLLSPVLNNERDAFFTYGDDPILQKMWAVEHGLSSKTSLEDILLSQIEEHKTEIFYNLDPMSYDSKFIKKLPGCVRRSICWRAAPSSGADFGAYNRVICNFPSILQAYRDYGWKSEYFAPAHDPVMDCYSNNIDRPIDVLFVGGYSRHHRRRAEVLEAVAGLSGRLNVHFHLDRSRLTRLSESFIGRFLPLLGQRRPGAIRAVSLDPIFGLDLYKAISQAKIVLNGAVDMSGSDRGNMRCFEAMGCGALMVSDQGKYPYGFENGHNMITYRDVHEATQKITQVLKNVPRMLEMSLEGLHMMRSLYGKEAQWCAFQKLVSDLG